MQLLKTTDKDFSVQFKALVSDRREATVDVSGTVKDILADVKVRGDAAVKEYTTKFDHYSPPSLHLSADFIAEHAAQCPPNVKEALELAAERIGFFHQKQLPQDIGYTDTAGVKLGLNWVSLSQVGIYVPGGRASYPSSVLMNALPAKIAGVERIVMAVPMPGGEINPAVLAAAQIAGVKEIYSMGGAQAIAALAYGTISLNPVDKIVGPGNAYVAEAKRQVFGTVGIDSVAGPSEILVVADSQNNPEWIAWDLLSQAEHDPSAQSILITDSASFAEKVIAAIEQILVNLPTKEVARTSWEKHGAIILVEDLADSIPLLNQLAPEHVELCVDNPQELANQIKCAGSIFLGRYTPEAIGDYLGGPNHVLPTARSARFASGLSVYDFLKRITYLECNQQALQTIGKAAVTLAAAEGLPAHGGSVSVRLH
ncbi:histidinol dehydrogenase [Nodularia spumigena]|uniref:histidinol dehydrogenase n=1 Tax=Nodularia spumigena TaxID=70799 RepID=UPI0023300CC5|nr:histidinol dehydrogenase [Nodularia spumigena]MDB9304195.1 histidinol dehydrogenase [Nodularia spumigena CS-591/12]MDB9318569.1 histidinol dehydrogenase [Nodularia spumigena CS-590/01A]MDB9320808.1 histidinol dehydrogenase [Nodularia spumigena CS-591/07A]MDB9328674.1 histidinol dehydrogenase [Nodularia spumigena CS-590/02]MDB9332664.1 histidinol dehydrogenase [Nodularia spumigena CS-591/04]